MASSALDLVREIVQHIDRQEAAALGASLRALLQQGPEIARSLPSIARKITALDGAQAHALKLTTVEVSWVRSVTVEPLMPAVVVAGAARGFQLRNKIGSFGAWFDELAAPSRALQAELPDLVVVFVDASDLLELSPAPTPDTRDKAPLRSGPEVLKGLLAELPRGPHTRLLVHGLMSQDLGLESLVEAPNRPEVDSRRRLALANEELAQFCRETGDTLFFDLDRWACRIGTDGARDFRQFSNARAPVASGAALSYAEALTRHISALWRRRRKVLITDLDDTLWGGTVGEVGPEGVLTGREFPGNLYLFYQQYLARLSRDGVLLAIASKNDPEIVDNAFACRAHDLAVPREAFVTARMGWGSKADAIKSIAEELSLGLDSMVFVDDSPLECEEIRTRLPEVAVEQVDRDAPWRTASTLEKRGYFDQVQVTSDDRDRTALYVDQGKRRALEKRAVSREDFLHSLGMRYHVTDASLAPFSRVHQLVSKTNQFNVTTRRYSQNELRELLAHPSCSGWAIRVSDRFGDSGIVGVMLARAEGTTCAVDTFLLSCRAIGRGVDTALLAHGCSWSIDQGFEFVTGRYTPTERNSVCADFFPGHGFVPVQVGQSKSLEFFLSLADGPVPTSPPWLEKLDGENND